MSGSITNTDILEALNQTIKAINDLAVSIVSGGGTGGAGGAGGASGPCGCRIPADTIVDPPAAPDLGVPGTDPPPDGFDTWADYRTYKCKAANKIIDDLISTCNNLTSIPGVVSGMSAGLLYMVINAAFFAGGSTSVAAGLLALGLGSAVGVAVVVTALVAICLAGISGLAYFATLASNLTAVKDDLVCQLYNAGSVEEARTGLYTAIDDNLAGIEGITEFLSDQINRVLTALLGTAVFNTLFEPNDSVSSYVGSVDCAGCNDTCTPELSFVFGSGDLSLNGEIRTLTSEVYPGNGLSYIRIENASADPCCMVYLEQISFTGDQPKWEMNQFKCDSSIVWEQNWFFMTAPYGSNVYGNFEYPGYISMGATLPFTVDVILDVAY